jgi:hypothetical protein
MGKLETMQRYAVRLLAKANVNRPVNIQWAGATCKLKRREIAHAHYDSGNICIRRGQHNWRDTIRHEIAHLLPGGRGHRQSFTKALARTGDAHAKAAMREYDIAVKGKRHHHKWIRGLEVARRTTSAGLSITYSAHCHLCGKEIP